MTAPHPAPKHILLVTGSMGAGHHAAARAVAERARELWPDVKITCTETLEGMGRATGPLFRAIYAGCIRHAGWLYELYFWLLWHVAPFRAAARAVIGRWSARGLAPVIARQRPDLIVATFPEGITGLAWLRRHGRLDVPTVALVADPAPHPMWADAALDLHLVSTEPGAVLLRKAAPGAKVRVAALPVAREFGPPPAAGEPPQRLARPARVLVSCGSLAFGDVAAACAGALDAGADVLVSAGRSAAVREALAELVAAHPRGAALEIVDWIDDPVAATRQADIVITNAGGATALEALACARPLLLADPVPGHGRANAQVLAAAGLARVCHGRAGVAEAVDELRDPEVRAVASKELRRRLASADLGADVAALAGLIAPTSPRGERIRAQDALFMYVSTDHVPQQVGARILAEDRAGHADWVSYLHRLVRDRAPGIELLCHRLAPPRPGHALRWTVDTAPDPEVHVRPLIWQVGPGTAFPTWDDALTAWFAEPLDPAVGWELLLARHEAAGETAVLAKVLHSLGDGLAVTDALIRLLTDEQATVPLAARAGEPGQPGAVPGLGARLRNAGTVLRGIASLALAGPAGRSPLTGPTSGPAPRRFGIRIDGAVLRRAARAHDAPTTVLLLAVLADALHDLLAPLPGGAPERVRAMVPMTTRTRTGVGTRAKGNRTAAVSVDLPTGAMPPAERVRRVAAIVDESGSAGQPEGGAAVLSGLGLLPGPVQARFARLVYGRHFFHVLASVMPGARRPLHLRGGLIREVYPVLPLADGVALAYGVLNWGRFTCIGITADLVIRPELSGISEKLERSLRRYADPEEGKPYAG